MNYTYKKKYLKYKKKYTDLKNGQKGGALPVPTLNFGIKMNRKTSRPMPAAKIKMSLHQSSYERSTKVPGVDVTNPYYEKNIKKKDLYSVPPVYSTFPEMYEPHAFVEEKLYSFPRNYKWTHPLTDNYYCSRKPLYPRKTPINIRFVTYNVHNWVKQCMDTLYVTRARGYPYTQGRNEDAALTTLFNLHGDILFLQEIVPIYKTKPIGDIQIESGNFEILIDKFRRMGYPYYYIGDTKYKLVNRPYYLLCNAIFSKYMIIESKTIGLAENRVVVMCLINVNGKYVACYNVHLEFKDTMCRTYQSDPLPTHHTCKQRQINKLASIIHNDSVDFDRKFGDSISYVLGGDFNNIYDTTYALPTKSPRIESRLDFTPITDVLKRVKTPILSESIPHGESRTSQSNQQGHRIEYRNIPRILDQFYVSPEILQNAISYIVPDVSSDHYPVVLDINKNDLRTTFISETRIPVPPSSPIARRPVTTMASTLFDPPKSRRI